MAKKYLDDIGLSHFFDKLKLLFATKDAATQSADGLMSSSDKTKLDGLDQLVESASGESVTVGDGSGFESLVVYGKSVQNSTPTPGNPVPIEVVESPFLAVTVYKSGYSIGATGTESQLSGFNILSCNVSGLSSIYLSYTQVVTNSVNNRFHAYDSNGTWLSQINVMQTVNGTYKTALTLPSGTAELRISTRDNTTINYVYVGSQEPAHVVSAGCIGLNVDGTITPIDLQGNILASLPDGTRDELTIDSTGAVTLTKRVGKVTVGTPWNGVYSFATVTNGARWYLTPGAMSSAYSQQIPDGSVNGYSTMAKFVKNSGGLSTLGDHMYTYDNRVYYVISGITTSTAAVDWVNSHNATVVYPLKTPQTITLTPITMPDVQSGDTITVVAVLTPTIKASWWTSFAQPIANAIKCLSQQT